MYDAEAAVDAEWGGLCLLSALPKPTPKNRLTDLSSPVLFRDDDRTAYRDQAIFYHNDSLYVFFMLMRVEADNRVYSNTAMRQTKDLRYWSPVRTLTPRDQRLDYSSAAGR